MSRDKDVAVFIPADNLAAGVTNNFIKDDMKKLMIMKFSILILSLGLMCCTQNTPKNSVKTDLDSNKTSVTKEARIEEFKTAEMTRELGNIKVLISQHKRLAEKPEIPYCKAEIKIQKNGITIDSIIYSSIEPLGGYYGLYINPELISNHLIITKYGDYDGRTIIINDKGEKFNIIGGIVYHDPEKELLFSTYDSDLSGLSVFDLTTDKEIYKMNEMKESPWEIYKSNDSKYYYKAVSNESNATSFWEFKFDSKTVEQIDSTVVLSTSKKLETLANYQKIDIKCE